MAIAAIPIIGQVISGVMDIINKRVPDVNQRAQLEAEMTRKLMEMDWAAIQGQLDINKVEAAHQSTFVAGWRPGVGWVCVTALGYNFVLQPILGFLYSIKYGVLPGMPILDTGDLMAILAGILGLGGMRTFEKFRGVAGGKQSKD